MKEIVIINGEKDSYFNLALSNMLDLLHLNFKILLAEERNESDFLEYAILNCRQDNKEYILKAKWYFINMDDINLNFQNNHINVYGNVITYGFGNKNTVTLSSISDEGLGFVYCIQRYLKLNDNYTLEPQEIPVDMEFNNDIDLYAVMIAITLSLIEGKNCAYIKKMLSAKKGVIFY